MFMQPAFTGNTLASVLLVVGAVLLGLAFWYNKEE